MAKLTGRKETITDAAPPGHINALLGKGSEFEGALNFEGIVRIDGVVRGSITSNDKLIIGDGAKVEADVQVGTAVLCGEVKGNIEASQRLEIRSSGRVYGDVYTPVLLVEEGALLEGVCHMTHDATRAKTSGEHKEQKASVSLLKSSESEAS